MESIAKFVLLALVWGVFIYLVNVIIARRWRLKTTWRYAVLWICAVGCIGMFGEIFIDATCHTLTNQTLWHYQLLPIHLGYTSAFGPIIWGGFGLYLYWQNNANSWLRRWPIWRKAALMAVEALAIEIIFNLITLVIFGQTFFYYTPPDLWHLTSLVGLPFWWLGGLVIYYSLAKFHAHPRFFAVMCACFALALMLV
jgi:hypothetical protein